jgi:hypothetical protein
VSGTASNPVAGATFSDNVESLAPENLTLGQIVIFELKIAVNGATTPENGVIDIISGWNTELTSGGDFGYDPNYGVYSAFIDTGDSAHNDTGAPVTLTSSWSWENLKKPADPEDEIVGDFHIEGLDDGDVVVLEVWLVLDSVLPPGSSGNVQSRLVTAETSLSDAINTGNQTVPLLKVQDFGSSISVGDTVWFDINENGIQDGAEAGLPDVQVDLYTVSGSTTNFVAGQLTDSIGTYLFGNLTPGDYFVNFTLPGPTYKFSPQDQGGDDLAESDADPTNGMTAVFTLLAGQTDLKWDAGMYTPPTLVSISSFGAIVSDGNVVVQWSTSSEQNALGFYLERLDEQSGEFVRVNADLIPASIFSTGTGWCRASIP